MTKKPPAPFDAAERALLRLEFFPRFGQAPSLAKGLSQDNRIGRKESGDG